MSHLQDNNVGYFAHLFRAWKWAFILIVHGLLPFIWETKVSDEICKNKNKKSREHLLKNMYGIDENTLNQNIKKWEFPWIDRNENL